MKEAKLVKCGRVDCFTKSEHYLPLVQVDIERHELRWRTVLCIVRDRELAFELGTVVMQFPNASVKAVSVRQR